VRWSDEPLRRKPLRRLSLDQACLEGCAKIHIHPLKCTSVVEKIIAASSRRKGRLRPDHRDSGLAPPLPPFRCWGEFSGAREGQNEGACPLEGGRASAQVRQASCPPCEACASLPRWSPCRYNGPARDTRPPEHEAAREVQPRCATGGRRTCCRHQVVAIVPRRIQNPSLS